MDMSLQEIREYIKYYQRLEKEYLAKRKAMSFLKIWIWITVLSPMLVFAEVLGVLYFAKGLLQ